MRFSFMMLAFLLVSCAHRTSMETSATLTPGIIFIGYKIFKGSDVPAAELRWYKLSEGTLKDNENKEPDIKAFHLELRDKEGKKVADRFLADVLLKKVEYVNDEGLFERQMIALDSADLIIRIPFERMPEKIVLSARGTKDSYITLHEFNLPIRSRN